MLDFRYFCDDGTSSSACRKPVTELPDALKEVLINGQIGGVILFGENIQNHAQLLTLIYQMQEVMARHNLPPLLVAIDQEGGRVARTPDTMATVLWAIWPLVHHPVNMAQHWPPVWQSSWDAASVCWDLMLILRRQWM